MATQRAKNNDTLVVSALKARSDFGKLLRQIEVERRSFVIEKGAKPAALLMNINDYVKLAVPEPDILETIGDEALRSGKSRLTPRQIDRVIQAARAEKKKC